MSKDKLRFVIVLTTVIITIIGAALVLIAAFYRPPLHAVLWYWVEGTVYKYDTQTKEIEDVKLPKIGKVRSARLSPSGHYLAFADDEGLKILDLQDNKIIHLVYHQLPSDKTGFKTLYLPRQWSPNENWLLVTSLPLWDTPLIPYLFSLKDEKLLDLSSPDGFTVTCPNKMSWSDDSSVFVMGRPTISGGPCEGYEGIFIGSVKDASIQMIYSESDGSGKPGGPTDVAWRPRHNEVGVLQQSHTDNKYALYTLGIGDSNLKVLYAPDEDQLYGLAWTSDGQLIYTVRQDQEDFSIDVVTLDQLNISSVFTAKDRPSINSVSPDNNWLVFYLFLVDKGMTVIQLMETQTHQVLRLTSDTYDEVEIAGWTLVP